MRRRAIALGVVAVLSVTAATAGVLAATPGDEGPRAPVPRVCWYSDYENAKLSNKCTWDAGEGRWYMEDEQGRTVPADTQQLPPANLCHYFHGETCPER